MANTLFATEQYEDRSVTGGKIALATILDENVSATADIARTKILNTAVTEGDGGTVTGTISISGGTLILPQGTTLPSTGLVEGQIFWKTDTDQLFVFDGTIFQDAGGAHAFGGAEHIADILANVNSKISDATLDDSGDARPPLAHAASHSNAGSDEITVENLGTASVDTSAALRPDGTGGLAFSDVSHTDLTGVTSDQHHPQLHAAAHADSAGDEISVESLATAGGTGTVPVGNGTGGLIMGDHGDIGGLSDDDHTQYILVDGTRAFTGVVGGITPTATTHLATKGYVDGLLQGLDWQESVLDQDLATPPGSPSTGDRYIIAATATGAWTGQEEKITEWDGSSWIFSTPTEGFATWVEDEDKLYVYNDAHPAGTWVRFGSTVSHDVLLDVSPDDHHNQAHVLATTAGLGADHTTSGLTIGQVLRASGATTAAFAVLQHSDLGGVGVDDHHNQSHVLATNTALGPDHTIAGAAAGQVLRASSATAANFQQLVHADLGSIGVNDHHDQSHVLATTAGLGADHTTSGLTIGQVLRASGTTAAAFAQLQHSDLGGVGIDDHHARDHAAAHSDAGADEIKVEDLGATSTDAALFLKPDGSGGLVFDAIGAVTTVATTDATSTTIATIAIPDNTVVLLKTDIVARRTDAAGRAAYMRNALVFREAAGSATILGSVDTPFTRESTVQYNATISVSGNNALITVQGFGTHNIDWKSIHTIEEIV